jgi:hypothetical protein
MRRFFSAARTGTISGAVTALLGCVGLFVISGVDEFSQAWASMTVRVARLEGHEVGAHSRVAQLEQEAAAGAEERVLDLPEDGNQWHTILVLRPGWQNVPAERNAEAMFHSEPLLVSLKHQTHWHLFTTDQAEYQKFRGLVEATPCLIVERANGEVVYLESGPDLGKKPHALTHLIRKEIQRHCPRNRCLPLQPVPGKDEPPPKENEIPAVLREEPAPAEKKANLAPLALVAGLGGLLGFAVKFKHAAGM